MLRKPSIIIKLNKRREEKLAAKLDIKVKSRDVTAFQEKIQRDAENEPNLVPTINRLRDLGYTEPGYAILWAIEGFKKCPGMTTDEAVSYCLDNKYLIDEKW
mgnify:CR=1 FL=1